MLTHAATPVEDRSDPVPADSVVSFGIVNLSDFGGDIAERNETELPAVDAGAPVVPEDEDRAVENLLCEPVRQSDLIAGTTASTRNWVRRAVKPKII